MYLLQRTDGQYVALPGQHSSYTTKLEDAKLFKSTEEAQRERCDQNETIVPLSHVMRGWPRY